MLLLRLCVHGSLFLALVNTIYSSWCFTAGYVPSVLFPSTIYILTSFLKHLSFDEAPLTAGCRMFSSKTQHDMHAWACCQWGGRWWLPHDPYVFSESAEHSGVLWWWIASDVGDSPWIVPSTTRFATHIWWWRRRWLISIRGIPVEPCVYEAGTQAGLSSRDEDVQLRNVGVVTWTSLGMIGHLYLLYKVRGWLLPVSW